MGSDNTNEDKPRQLGQQYKSSKLIMPTIILREESDYTYVYIAYS
jgi:hypothetical protein